MARLPDPTGSLDDETQALYDQMAAKRGRLDGMYTSLFNHPELVRRISALGTFLRFEATLPGEVRELAILLTARRLGVGYEWVKHVPPAGKAELSPSVIEAVRQGRDLAPFSTIFPLVERAVETVLDEKSLEDALQQSMEERFGLKGVMEIVILVGFYRMIAAYIRAFDVPLPPGSAAPF
ncbi:MAG: carboxymuconolactone decarboxylase family protein [bacterium]